MNLWIVGKADPVIVGKWEFQGVFDTERDAVAACHTDNYFVAPARLNVELPDESTEWEGLYWPRVNVPNAARDRLLGQP